MQGQIGRGGVRYYRCGRNRDAGHTVCNNTLLRPVAEADRAVIGAVSRYLDDDVIARVIREVKKQLAEQGRKSNAELPRMEDERAKLVKEIDRLAEAVAISPNVTALAKKLSERQERLNELDARIQVLKTAPNVIDLELKRLEVATRERLAKLHETMRGNIQEARQALQSVLESPLTMTPREDASGREYAITGRLVLGDALALDATAPSRQDQARGLGVADYSRPQRDSNPC